MILDSSLSFNEHLIGAQSKTNKTIGLLCKLQSTFPRQALITIYKAFARPHLDYGKILYDQAYNASFHQKLEKSRSYLWYLKRKTYQELALESLESRRRFSELCFFFKTLQR